MCNTLQIPIGQRQNYITRLRAPKHAMVLWRGHLCRQGYQINAKLREDQI